MYHRNTIRWPFNTLEPDPALRAEPLFKEYPCAPSTALTSRDLSRSTGEAMRDRISCRSFSETPLALDALGAMLAVSYGVEGEFSIGSRQYLERPVPSGGGLYPLELYPIVRRVDGLEAGIYHYAPLTHALEQLTVAQFSPAFISQLFMNQPYLSEAAAIILMTAVVERSMHKYGDRGYRYILLECGHVAQNICLAAACMDLGSLPIGGFFDGYLAELMGIDLEEEIIVYGMAVGPASTAASDRIGRRNLSILLGG
jgi:SagB-type dehydrogenase family enzyme